MFDFDFDDFDRKNDYLDDFIDNSLPDFWAMSKIEQKSSIELYARLEGEMEEAEEADNYHWQDQIGDKMSALEMRGVHKCYRIIPSILLGSTSCSMCDEHDLFMWEVDKDVL